jgi:uncharacterized protein YceK
MKITCPAALVVLPPLLACGCGTICNLASNDPDFYGGFRKDVQVIQTPHTLPMSARPTGSQGRVIIAALLVADAGLSLVADTLTFPVVVFMRRGDPGEEDK